MNFCNKLQIIKTYIIHSKFINFSSYIFFVSFIHWCIFLLYTKYCFSFSYFGFLDNVVNMGSPFCHTLNIIQFKLSDNFNIICITVSSYLLSKLIDNSSIK